MSRTACRSVVPSSRTWRALGYAALHARHSGPTAGDKADDYYRDRRQKILASPIPRLACPLKPVSRMPFRAEHWPLNMLLTARWSRQRCSSGILGERHRSGAGAVVSLDVDERHRAAVNLPLGAAQSRANFVGAFDIFAVAAEGFGLATPSVGCRLAAALPLLISIGNSARRSSAATDLSSGHEGLPASSSG